MLRKLSRDANVRGSAVRLGAAAAVTVALGLSGCSAAYVEGDASSMLMLIETIAAGSPVLSDVRGTGGAIINCQVDLSILTRPKNQTPESPVGPSEDVRVTRYDVAYRRSDGRGTQGLDVPYSISGNMTLLVRTGTAATVVIDLVRHQAKLEPPLSNIVGLQVVTMFADVTLYGQTISGKTLRATGSAQVTFADFADGTSTCEGS
jgi:hypothetical protein